MTKYRFFLHTERDKEWVKNALTIVIAVQGGGAEVPIGGTNAEICFGLFLSKTQPIQVIGHDFPR
jgi:hypothetical protein